MISDVCAEYLVKHKIGAKEIILQALIVLLAAGISFAGMFFLGGPIGALITVLVIYGAYYLITSFFLEYECIFTNGDLDVDKIINQRKRERLCTVKCENVELFKLYRPEEHVGKEYQTKIIAVADEKSNDNYCVVATIKDKGRSLVVFTPDEKIIDSMKKFIPRGSIA